MAGLGDVGADLGLEGFDGRKLLFAAQLLDEGNFEVLAVEVATEIEDVNFDEAAGDGVWEGGTEADVDDGGALLNAGGIDAIGRKDFVVEIQVRGREAKGGATVVAGFDGAVEAERATEHGGGAVEESVEDVLTNGRGADHFAIGRVDGGNLGDSVAEAGSVALHEGGVAGAVVSEVETGADTDLPDAVRGGGELFEERFSRRIGEFAGERQNERGVNAQCFDQRKFVRRGGEQRRRFVGMEDAHGMRIEGENNAGGGDDALVAEVNAIEDANGDVDGAVQRSEFSKCVEDLHQAGLMSFRIGMTCGWSFWRLS